MLLALEEGYHEDPIFSNVVTNIYATTSIGFAYANVTWIEPTVTDNSGHVTLASNFQPGDKFYIGDTRVTYNATDPDGNSAGISFVVSVIDMENATFSNAPGDIVTNTNYGEAYASVTWMPPTILENSGVHTLTSDYNPGDNFNIGVTLVTYMASDSSGNVAVHTFTITVIDNESPSIFGLPANINKSTDVGLATAVVNWLEATAKDNSGSVTLSSSHSSGDTFPIGDTIVVYLATDAASNQVQDTFTVTIQDNEYPVLAGVPANITQNTDIELATSVVNWTEPTASDNSGVVSLTSSHVSGDMFPIGVTVVTYTAIDDSSNKVTESFSITIEYDEYPVLAGVPANITQNTDIELATSVVNWAEPTASDNSGFVSLTSSHVSGDMYPIGVTVVTYTAIDDASNIATESFSITIEDDEYPVLAGVPANITQNTDIELATSVVNWTEPTASDNSGVVSLTSSHVSGDMFPIGVTVVTYTAIDDASNKVTESFSITIEDDEYPVLAGVPANITQNTDIELATSVVNWAEPTASDNSGFVSLTSSHVSGDMYPIGVTVVTYTAIDDASNIATESFSITIEDDEYPALAGVPANITQNTDIELATSVVNWTEPTASDNSGLVSLTSSYVSGDMFPIGVTVVTYTAIDDALNKVTESFSITIEDNEYPVLAGVPANITHNTDIELATSVVTWTEPTASDNSGFVSLTSSHVSGDMFPIGVTVVTYTAIDDASNKVTESFSITIEDNEYPVLTGVPANITQNTDIELATSVVNWTEPIACDNSGLVSLTSSHVSGDMFPIGVTVVTYTSIDDALNKVTESFSITIEDNEYPVLAGVPANITQNTDIELATSVVNWTEPTASDNSGLVSLTSSHVSGDMFPIGVTVVTYTAIDDASNIVTESFSITIEDNEYPVLAGVPASITQNTDIELATSVVNWTEPTASDNSGLVSLTSSHVSGDMFPIGVTVVTYTAIDDASNIVTESFSITIEGTITLVLFVTCFSISPPTSFTIIANTLVHKHMKNVMHQNLLSSDYKKSHIHR
ncbi:hyalin-like [Amphiura filiformis]|uniref:hyalin-like n=1 Tax=Amphiura filiformis TaxID=82378 RepID=UPI003B222FFF